MRGILTILIVFISTTIFATDSIYVAMGYDTVLVDMGDKFDYDCNVPDGGKLFVCPAVSDKSHYINYRIGSQELTGATYYMKYPDTNEGYSWEFTHEMSGEYDFQKVRNSITYNATVEVLWVVCPSNPPVISGKDTVINNSSSETYSIPTSVDASAYEWYITPNEAGTIEHTDETASFTVNESFVGEANIYAIAVQGMAISGDDTLSVKSIIIQDPPTNIQNNTLTTNVNIFPNPAQDHLTIDISNTIIEYSIYSTSGTLLNNKKTNKNTINISDLLPGVYILNIKTEDDQEFKTQFIKQ